VKEKIDIHEKMGDFLLNLIQLAVGGVIFAAIMADKSINPIVLYTSAIGAIIFMLFFAVVMYRTSNKKDKLKKE